MWVPYLFWSLEKALPIVRLMIHFTSHKLPPVEMKHKMQDILMYLTLPLGSRLLADHNLPRSLTAGQRFPRWTDLAQILQPLTSRKTVIIDPMTMYHPRILQDTRSSPTWQ